MHSNGSNGGLLLTSPSRVQTINANTEQLFYSALASQKRFVIQDIISTMLNDQFIKELFEPQHMYSRSAMQSVFEKLVHSSIMRLNSNSMSKLYDLMLMVFKYQVINCENAEEILLVTLNHMDAIRNCAKPYPELKDKIENVYSLLISNYKDMPHEDYECLYKCIAVFLQDLNIRVRT
ncbi:UNVERIFIED_CONTAM: Protein OSCP1 [Trichonephila clavipes]